MSLDILNGYTLPYNETASNLYEIDLDNGDGLAVTKIKGSRRVKEFYKLMELLKGLNLVQDSEPDVSQILGHVISHINTKDFEDLQQLMLDGVEFYDKDKDKTTRLTSSTLVDLFIDKYEDRFIKIVLTLLSINFSNMFKNFIG